jgi:predicted ABC-type ATPase
VVGGPNGAGKTTFALEYLPRYADCREFVNPDLIAAGLSPLDPPAAGVRAGRLVLERIGALAARRVSFGFETTCSGRGHLATLSRLKTTGYRVCLILVWVSTLDLCAARIACRVRAGGHGVPEADQRRRFARILANLRQYRALADRFVVIENGGPGPVLVYECSESGGLIIDPERFRRISQEVHL